MTDGWRKEFGRRGAKAPPIVTNRPNAAPNRPQGPLARRKRSLTVGLVSVGAISLGAIAFFETPEGVKCPEDQSGWDQTECKDSGGGSSSSHARSGSSSSRSWSSSSSSGHSVSFGGFGGIGAAHFSSGS
jgi:uncharacterized membrane protein